MILLALFLIREQTKSSTTKVAERVYALLKEDLREGKFRNGIRVDDIYLVYGIVVNGDRDFFYSQVLPKMEKRMPRPS